MRQKIELILTLVYTLIRLLLRGFPVWRSWTGWGITLSWPSNKFERELEWLLPFLNSRHQETHFVHGPAFAAGGAMVVYLWPKSDPQAKELLEPKPETSAYR